MPTVNAVIKKDQRKADGTWNIKLRITHNRQVGYISTVHYVDERMIDKRTGELKTRNNPAYDAVMVEVLNLRKMFTEMGGQIEYFSMKGIIQYIKDRKAGKGRGIDFFGFAEEHIEELKADGRRMHQSYHAMISRMKEYVGSDKLDFNEITADFLIGFERYLRNSESKNGFGKISDSGVRLYMGKVSHLINLAKLRYNDEDSGLIRVRVNPFAKYQPPRANEVKKKALTVEQIRQIMNCGVQSRNNTVMFARDVFMISFLTCGTNTVDLYRMKPPVDGRLEYERSKTKGRRDDKAFISIKIQPELEPYLERYGDSLGDRAFNFFTRYTSDKQFVTKTNLQLKRIGEALGIPKLTFYAARHSFATIARNDCGFSMDDVALCLNHKSAHSMTDVYVKKDWSRIDNVNRAVIDLLFETE